MYTVDRVKWQNMPLFEQLGNIYSEVGRTSAALKMDDEERAEAAVIRALDLFDATTESLLNQKQYARLREILRAKEQFSGAFLRSDKEELTSLENYFMQYALVARKGK